MTIFNFLPVLFRKQINISVMLVSESYVLLYYEKKVYMLFISLTIKEKHEFPYLIIVYHQWFVWVDGHQHIAQKCLKDKYAMLYSKLHIIMNVTSSSRGYCTRFHH